MDKLQSRRLGSQGLVVSTIGLGCMGMTYAYSGRDDAESEATVQLALDLGVTLFDTAEVYGPYTNEELLGRALGPRRKDVIVATKFGFKLDPEGRVAGLDSRPEHIREVVEASLRRLKTDWIDLLYQHRVDHRVPIEDVAGTVGGLVREGKVKYFGLSEASVETVRRAHGVFPVSAVQNEYSLWERSVESGLLATLDELDIGLVAYSPLGRGFLTGTAKRAEDYDATDYRRRDPRYHGENYERNVALLNVVTGIAERLHITPAQVAIAWLLHRSKRVVPIPGTKRRGRLMENLRSGTVTLDEAALQELDALLSITPVAGPRYEEPMLRLVNR